jgi:cyanophycinase
MGLLFSLFFVSLVHAEVVGPAKGTLIVIGGGVVGPEIRARFLSLAGGEDAPVVVIPTANEREDFLQDRKLFKNVILLHTRSRDVANSEEFVAPLKKTRAVWISGGRQWRLVDAYLGTRTQRELEAFLERGGVIAGTSAGATICGSYLVRGAREGNQIMMAKGYEEGFGLLRNVAIDQHLIKRNRVKDLVQVMDAHPQLLGIGIDESTAIEVAGDRFKVLGVSKVAIYEHGKPYYFLERGAKFDLVSRKPITSE